jgi:ribonuclease VapC
MILDTSAIVAAVANEPDGARFQNAMITAESMTISAIGVLETRIVLHSRYGTEAVRAFDELLADARISIIPFDFELAQAAFDAFRRFGKGQGHRAQLNIIDCTAYALAKIRREPLLLKGNDFEATDIDSAISSV